MGELKPCPFCGFRMIASDALRTRNRTVYVHEAHEGECPAMNVIIHSDNQARITAWNTRPRTEGRGEETRTVEVCPDCDIADCHHIRERRKQAAREVLDMYASPIREPEISREAVLDLVDSIGRTFYRSLSDVAWSESRAKFADAILNLAPVGGRGEPDEVTEDALLTRAKALIQHKGWKPGDKFSAWNVAQLMVAFGLDLTRQPEAARCGHPDCGCDFDAVCDAALPPPPQEQGGMK